MCTSKNMIVVAMLGLGLSLSACSAERAVDHTVNATGFVAKTAVKGTIGAGRLAVKGAKKVAGAE